MDATDRRPSRSKWLVKGAGADLWWFLEVKGHGVLAILTTSSPDDPRGKLKPVTMSLLQPDQAAIFILPESGDQSAS